eukprot:363711-Chlamydomonas_euryale.AAC.2
MSVGRDARASTSEMAWGARGREEGACALVKVVVVVGGRPRTLRWRGLGGQLEAKVSAKGKPGLKEGVEVWAWARVRQYPSANYAAVGGLKEGVEMWATPLWVG